jgi:dipeptidase
MKRTHMAWLAGIVILLLGIPAAGQGNALSDDDDDHCTSIAVGRLASVDGSVIGSHDGTCHNSRLHVVPARDWPPGSMAPVYYGLMDVPPGSTYEYRGKIIGEIPQVPHTYAYLHTGYPHMNEHQLMIAESTLDQREELEEFVGTGEQIMTIEQAQLFALQRCRTARDAVKLIGSLLEEYGFLPSAGPGGSEGLLICDPQQVWLLEVCSVPVSGWKRGRGVPGAIWVAQRIPDDHIVVLANTHIIRDIDLSKPDSYMGSANYKQAAIDMGWYNPAGGEPFRFYEAYGSYPVDGDLSRLWLFYSTFAPSYRTPSGRDLDMKRSDFYDPYHTRRFPTDYLPLSAKPDKPLSVQDVMKFQRSVFEGTVYDMTADTDWYVPDGKGGFVKSPLTTPFPSKDWRDLLDIPNNRQVAKSTGTYGYVGQVRSWMPDWIGGKYWFYVSNQYVSTFAPVYAGVSKISPLYSTYNGEAYQPDSAWWAVRAVFNVMHLKFKAYMEELRAWRDPLEQRFLSEEKDIEAKALELYKRNPAKAQEYLTGYTMNAMKEIVDKYHNFFWHLVATGYTH